MADFTSASAATEGGALAAAPPVAPAARAAASAAPPAIRKLDENVVNKIAAGEVIQRPASALKEMLENSLDAGSTQISVLVKEGGNKLLQITDNGCGIRKDDLPILCHRHTTSKLREFEDLQTLSTLGFRGEALCSISFVSHMSVTTMARGAQYGYRVNFKDSEMEPPGPRPVAAVPGTTISVEDLFFNVPTRRKALKSASEEYSHILDVVGRYAVYSTGVAISCRRAGESRPDISTTATGSRLDAVRAVYGADVARELLPLLLEAGGGTGPEVSVDGPLGLRVEGLLSGANYVTGKKTVLVLFINGRCVECSPLRRCLEGLYASLLPKAARPWLFLDVRLPPRQVEVNMHPTKREVGFMHQVEVIEEIRRAVEAKLLASNESRTFATTATLQTQLPFAPLAPPPPGSQRSPGQQQGSLEPGAAADAGDDAEECGGGGDAQRDEEEDGDDEEGERDEEAGAGRKGARAAKRRRVGQAAGTEGGAAPRRPAGGGSQPLPYRPEKLVRVDYRAGTLDTFVIKKGPAAGAPHQADGAAAVAEGSAAAAARAAATTAGGGAARKRSAAARTSGHAFLGREEGPETAEGRPLPPALVTAGVLGLGPYAGSAYAGTADGGEQGDADGGVGDQDPGVSSVAVAGHAGGGAGAGPRAPARRAPPPVETSDPTVLGLLGEVDSGAHTGLADLLREHTFVGVADGSLVLLQSGTRLYLVEAGQLSRDMMYQLALRRWEKPLPVRLEPPPLVSELVALGLQLLEARGEWQPEDGSPAELGELVTELLQQNGPELSRQLGLAVDEQGRLVSVPMLLEGLPPDPARLPDLVVALAKDVDWEAPLERARALAGA
ncbi:hypothetical protein GPECTOR_3g445 [Gonium pectorale]|uniref:DNA mismatch repair protein S5 domain-containing protein n=1 Tax=Gonium pectorale TaxID=33097 RepID=A0A150GZN8_GONPE|nr:hypothetical protein GPECTOR_3g445 [Gonium pectorale]|eukprot:KXZ55311.1 hypothetical protein GPECTOR_3g445 [Gonium pectorale]